MAHTFLFLTAVVYSVSWGFYTHFLRDGRLMIGRIASLLLAAGVVLHYFALLDRARALHTVPYNDLYGSMSLFGWLLALTYLALEIYHRQRSVGAFVLPFIIAFFLAAHLSPAGRVVATTAHGVIFALHITLSILAYAAFALSCVFSLIFLAEERLLRSHKMADVVWRLPSLELLQRMSQSSVLVGIISIAIGTAFGFVWVDRLTGQFWHFDSKYVATLMVLALYAAYFYFSRSAAWRGSRASRFCIINFVVVILSFTVVNLFFSQTHRYF
jgi:HemX protein